MECDFASEPGAKLCSFIAQAVTINYHHTTGSRAPSLDDDEEEEDRLHAMISMICSRNLTDPNVMKGFYHQWPSSFSLPPFILPLLPLFFPSQLLPGPHKQQPSSAAGCRSVRADWDTVGASGVTVSLSLFKLLAWSYACNYGNIFAAMTKARSSPTRPRVCVAHMQSIDIKYAKNLHVVL